MYLSFPQIDPVIDIQYSSSYTIFYSTFDLASTLLPLFVLLVLFNFFAPFFVVVFLLFLLSETILSIYLYNFHFHLTLRLSLRLWSLALIQILSSLCTTLPPWFLTSSFPLQSSIWPVWTTVFYSTGVPGLLSGLLSPFVQTSGMVGGFCPGLAVIGTASSRLRYGSWIGSDWSSTVTSRTYYDILQLLIRS